MLVGDEARAIDFEDEDIVYPADLVAWDKLDESLVAHRVGFEAYAVA